jgi:hypothetical protein
MVLISLNNVIVSQNNKEYIQIQLDNKNYILEIIVLNNKVHYLNNNDPVEITFENVISNNIDIDVQYLIVKGKEEYLNREISLRKLTCVPWVKNPELIPESLLPQITKIILNNSF